MSRLVLVLFAVLAVPAAAQTRVVPLDEALGLARTHAIAVLRADADVRSARASADAVHDGRWPALSLEAGGGQRYGLSFDQTSGGLTQATVQSLDVGLSAEVVVFDGFERRAQARSAEALVRSAELTRARAEQASQVAVLQGYLAIAQAEAARTVATEDSSAQADLLAEVRAQVELGERAGYEASQQEERVATAQAAILAAERDRRLAEARLVRVLGIDPTADITFPAPETPAPPVPDTEALIGVALGARADLQAASAAVEASEADVRAARASRLPSVRLGASVGTSYTSAAEVGFPGQIGDNRAGGLRVGVSVPLFDRGVSRARTRQAEVRTVALAAEQEDARRAVALEVQERAIAIDALRQQRAVAEVRVRAAAEALQAERARFQAGETTLQAVSLLQARAVEARTAQERLAIEARFEALLLRVAVGEGSTARAGL